MSSPEEILVAKLKGLTAVSTLVSSRVYPISIPQVDSLPAIIYEMSGDNPCNYAGGATGTTETRLTVTCIADSYGGVKALAAAVRGDENSTAPTGVSGWTDTGGNVWHLDSLRDAPGEVIVGQDLRQYHGVEQEYSVWH
jgi:hypothetical protein